MKKIALALAVSSMMAMGAANAATTSTDLGHGKITFTGSVIDAACSIDSQSLSQDVELGAIAKHALENNGKSTPIDFKLTLRDCDTGSLSAGTASITFNGVAGNTTEGLAESFATTGQAAGTVGVVITDLGGNVIKPGDASQPIALATGDNDMEFQAYVLGAKSSIATGKFQSVANFVMDYQ
ncbi:fimbrial protein [Dryocola sp. BD626]|uniref:fimbrial protein n=1 Tax=Dryocola sp. BD626 TaxID=3133273 RepID=UPI003F505BF7